jgi:hypothetical protein
MARQLAEARFKRSVTLGRGQRILLRLAGVKPVLPGRHDDGLVKLSAGTELDKTWDALSSEFADALGAWRKNPLARRLVSLVSSFVCGDGITLTSDRRDLARFLAAFWDHPENQLALRQYAWCEELSRSGELFITLHMNPADGMSYVRALPASSIDKVITTPGDYENETAYHEQVGLDDPDYPAGRIWRAPAHPLADDPSAWDDLERPQAVCLHFAVNRPVGCVRGESDLAPVLAWLARYSRWLEDRTMLNAAVRAFLWVIKVPGAKVAEKQAQYAHPPRPGSVLVLDKESESWEAVAPSLHANDAQADGRAIRWMIVAGGPGVGLVDMGEGEEANLATAKAMGEQRSRFMRARQQYFAWALATVALTAYNRAVRLGRVRGKPAELRDIRIGAPDISPADNSELGASAQAVANALASVGSQGVGGEKWRRLVVRTVLRFAGEALDEHELGQIVAESLRDSAK